MSTAHRPTRIHIRNWEKFQHFKDRDPIWIKLYRELRHKREWRVLPGDAAKLLVDLWMLASETPDHGDIDLISTDLEFELRATWEDMENHIQTLAAHGFIELDIETISDGYQEAIPRALAREEKRREEISPIGPLLQNATKTPRKRKCALPDTWQPNESHRSLAESEQVDLHREAAKFRDHAAGSGRLQLDWDRTFSVWLRRAHEYGARSAPASIGLTYPDLPSDLS